MSLFIPNLLLDYVDLRVYALPLKQILIFICRFFYSESWNFSIVA